MQTHKHARTPMENYSSISDHQEKKMLKVTREIHMEDYLHTYDNRLYYQLIRQGKNGRAYSKLKGGYFEHRLLN